jgi:hypothetical protein
VGLHIVGCLRQTTIYDGQRCGNLVPVHSSTNLLLPVFLGEYARGKQQQTDHHHECEGGPPVTEE